MRNSEFARLYSEFKDKAGQGIDDLNEEELIIFCQGIAAGKSAQEMGENLVARLGALMESVIAEHDETADPYEPMLNNDAYDQVGKDRKSGAQEPTLWGM